MSAIEHQPTGFVPIPDDDLAYATEEERDQFGLYVVSENYLDKPDDFVADVLDEYLWSIQAEIAYSVRDHRHTAVPSCHDAGKSFVVSRIAAWWINSHAPGEAFVVSTAPTFPQVRAILWREINMAHAKGNLVGSVNQTEWHLPGVGLVGYGRKPADTNAQGFQGIHARYVLVIIDEANGVSKAIFDAVETLATNEDARVIAIGNPDDPTSEFAEVCKPGSGWNVIEIDGYNTPNLSGEWVPAAVRPLLLSPTWIEERKRMWGEDSALFQSKVRGKFPEGAADGVVRYAGVSKCQYVEPMPGPVEIGADIGASEDGDATVFRVRRGNVPGEEVEMHTDDSEEIVNKLLELIISTGATAVKIDVIGVGFGVAGSLRARLKEIGSKCKVVPVNVSESSSDKARFMNLRSQIWWEVGREAFDDGLYSIGLLDHDKPHDQRLDTIGELLAPKFTENSKGRIQVEPKADTRKRIGKSPDHADAFLLAFYQSIKTGPGKSFGPQIRNARIG